MRTAAILGLGLIASLGGCARLVSAVSQPSIEPAALVAGNYAIDPAHASVVFRVEHMGLSHYVGRFNELDASLDIDPNAPANARLDARIAADSIDTGNEALEEKLVAPAMFDAARFQELRFVSTAVRVLDATHAEIDGLLTIKTVERPVTLAVTFNGGAFNPLTGKETLGFSATTAIERSAFGLSEWIPLVGDRVAIAIEAEFQRTGASAAQ